MGGGGGNSGSSGNYKEHFEQSKNTSEDAAFESEVNRTMNDRLKAYNDRDSDQFRAHLDEIKDIIEAKLEGAIKLKFGGSVSKHTYVDGLSDADILMLINNSELSGYSPDRVLSYVKRELSGKLRGVEEIKIGSMAVTIKFRDGCEIQLIPAVSTPTGYKVPRRHSNEWSKVVRPDKFAQKLTDVNQSCGGKVIPVIKLAKGIVANLPEDQHLTGYHIESLAIEVFKKYPQSMPNTSKAMLKYFFEQASKRVTTPITDSSGQSVHTDDYLGVANSPQRLRAQRTLGRIHTSMQHADNVKSLDAWEKTLGEIQ